MTDYAGSVAIRAEQPGDATPIRETIIAAFGQSAEADLVTALAATRHCLASLVAVADGNVVGHIVMSPARIEGAAPMRAIGALAPLAVRPQFQRRGIGTRLVVSALDEMRRMDQVAVVVLGDPAYYSRFGFVPASSFGIRSTFAAPREAFQAIELKAGGLAGSAGLCHYAPEFDAL